MKLNVVSNIPSLGAVRIPGVEIAHHDIPRDAQGPLRSLRYFWRHRTADYMVINGSGPYLFLMALAKILLPLSRMKIVSLDLLLSRPATASQRLKSLVKRLLLRQVHLFALYYRNTRGIQQAYGIPDRKFRYVPFKINRFHEVLNAKTADRGYVFCGGKTRRDFATLIEAVRGTDLPVRIVTLANEHIAEHGSFLDRSNLPGNVEVIVLDGSFAPFLEQMAGSRLVVMPLKPDICGCGIGVYLMAMALRKCVVISNDVGVDGVLSDEAAVIVPPCDPPALRKALEKAYHDAQHRSGYEENGYRYALSLGDESRLAESIMEVLTDDFTQARARR